MLNKFLFKYLKEIKLSIIDRGKRKNWTCGNTCGESM